MTIKSKVIKFTTAASFAVAGIATLSAAKLNSLSFNGTAQASTLQAPAKEIGVVKVNSKTGESIAVWNSYEDGKQQTGKYLPYQSSWKTYKKVKTVKGETWYNLGGNQWISSDNVEEEAPIAVTADLSAVATTVSQVPAANVANNNAAQAPVASLLLGFEVACFLVAACPLLISANPKGIVIALTIIDTIPITKLVVALFP